MDSTAVDSRLLARCNGFRVVAAGEVVGAVATPVFSGTKIRPDYLLVRVAEALPGAYREVRPEAIADVDAATGTVFLQIGDDDVAKLPEAEVVRLRRPE